MHKQYKENCLKGQYLFCFKQKAGIIITFIESDIQCLNINGRQELKQTVHALSVSTQAFRTEIILKTSQRIKVR